MASTSSFAINQSPTSPLPMRLHHNAYVCEDQERTRHFYEDVLGLPLLQAWVEEAELKDFPGKKTAFSHAFYGIGDGGALAFFQFPDPEVAAHYKAVKQSMFVHIALAISNEGQEALKQRLIEAKAFGWETDHGYCKSIYALDPDGLLLEFTVDPVDVERINEQQRRTAHETLRRWQAGDRSTNNDIRPPKH